MSDAGGTGAGARILVVDDNDDNRYTLTERLRREGYANLATAATVPRPWPGSRPSPSTSSCSTS